MSGRTYKLNMVNFRPTKEEREKLRYLINATERSVTYIMRKALSCVTVDDLMRPLNDEESEKTEDSED